MDPRGFPTSLPEFQKVFPDDAACAKYLENVRWPSGFVCSDCGWTGEPYRFKGRSSVVLRFAKKGAILLDDYEYFTRRGEPMVGTENPGLCIMASLCLAGRVCPFAELPEGKL